MPDCASSALMRALAAGRCQRQVLARGRTGHIGFFGNAGKKAQARQIKLLGGNGPPFSSLPKNRSLGIELSDFPVQGMG